MLTELDLKAARKIFPEASSDHVLLMSLHKARYESLLVAGDLRHASRAWLEDHGYGRYTGMPWPPDGKLPE